MNNDLLTASPLEERTDILFREIELAARWDRPSILFAIYKSDDVRTQVMAELERRLSTIDQKVQLLTLTDKNQVNALQNIASQPGLSQTILFLDGFKNDSDVSRLKAFEQINKYREYFIDNSLRAVFWLVEQDVQKFAARATECWYLRHRVVDFTDEIKPAQLFLDTLESCMQVQPGENPQCRDAERVQQEIENLSDELTTQPSHATVLFILGTLWARKNDAGHAMKFLQAALDIASSTNETRMQERCLQAMARVQAGAGKMDAALDFYKQVLALSSKPARVWNNIGLMHKQNEKYLMAAEAFQTALRLTPQDENTWIELGDAYIKLGQTDNAASAYESALEIAPDSDRAWTGLGMIDTRLGAYDPAVAAFLKAVQANPENTSAWIGLGQAYLHQKRESDAMLAYQKATETGSQNVDAWNQLGLLYIKQQKYERAIAALQKAIQLKPDSGEAFKNLGIAEYNCGNYPRAAYLFEQAIPLYEDRMERSMLWKYLAETCRKMKNDEMADSAYKQAVQLSQPLPPPIEEVPVPEISEQAQPPQEQENGGTAMMEDKNTFEDRTAKDWNDLGNSFLKAGAYKKAVFSYTKAIELSTDNSWPYIKNLAVANYKMGKLVAHKSTGQEEVTDIWETEEDDETTYSILEDFTGNHPDEQIQESGEDARAHAGEVTSTETDTQPIVTDLQAEAAQESSPTAEEWNEWGNNYATSGDFDKAIESYKKSIQADPKFGHPYSNLGFLLFKRGDYRLAALLYQKGIEYLVSVEDKAATLNRLGDTFHHLRRFEDAAVAYRKARDLAPSKNPVLDRARISVLQNSIR